MQSNLTHFLENDKEQSPAQIQPDIDDDGHRDAGEVSPLEVVHTLAGRLKFFLDTDKGKRS